MDATWVHAERDSASDDGLLISRILVGEGSEVRGGQAILEVEGSKSLFEIHAPSSGVVFFYVEEGVYTSIGDVVACITSDSGEKPTRPTTQLQPDDGQDSSSERDRFSDAAWALVRVRGLDPSETRPDLDFVMESDLLQTVTISQGRPVEIPQGAQRIALLGGSYGATLAYDACLGSSTQGIIGVFDDTQNLLTGQGIPTMGRLGDDFVNAFQDDRFDACLIVVQADMETRRRLYSDCKDHGIPLATVIHPRAQVSALASLGNGCLVLDATRIGPFAILDENVFVSGSVNIDHHCHIGPHTTFGPAVYLSGGVRVGSGCNFGTAIGVESHITIGARCTVTSGSIIQANVADDHIVKVASQTVIRSKIHPMDA